MEKLSLHAPMGFRYWKCPHYGAVLDKGEGYATKAAMYLSPSTKTIGTVRCGKCGDSVDVKEVYGGKYDVFEEGIQGGKYDVSEEKVVKAKKPWIAAVRNLIFPGLGFFYIGSTKSIIGGMILFLLTLLGASVSPTHPSSVGWAIIWAIIGYYAAKRHNKRNERSWW